MNFLGKYKKSCIWLYVREVDVDLTYYIRIADAIVGETGAIRDGFFLNNFIES